MSKKFQPLIAATLSLASIFIGYQASAESITGTATATVASALTVTEETQLSFGTFSAGETQGTISTTGTATGGVTPLTSGGPGKFRVNGSANTQVKVEIGAMQLTNTTGDQMNASGSVNTPVDIGTNGEGGFEVDAVLTVAENQPNGVYTGAYGVTVNYQ